VKPAFATGRARGRTLLASFVALSILAAYSPPAPLSSHSNGPARASSGDDSEAAFARAKALCDQKDWSGAVEILSDRLRRGESDAATHELYGNALMQLARLDEAAHWLDIAAHEYTAAGKEDKARAALASLRRADPFSPRRDSFLRKVSDTLTESAEELLKAGHTARAIQILERVAPIAQGKESAHVSQLLEKANAASKEVHLDEQAQEKPASGERPFLEYESQHYKFACALESDVVKRLGSVMDDIHAFYVQVYFDGDEKKAKSQKPTIRVFPTRKKMLETWQGGEPPDGWWSAGTNEVITFDSRTPGDDTERGGSLDYMLNVLFHEASHQFMSLIAKGGYTPSWLNEGTATFFEGAVAMSDGRVLWPDAAIGRLGALCWELQNPKSPTPTAVVSYPSAGSYPSEDYAYGWGLVYFLQQYEDAKTREYVYRPLYAEYRTKVIERGGEPMKVFEEVFLGKRSPLGHRTFADFEKDWKNWILTEVRPLHDHDAKARALRLDRAKSDIAEADAVKGKKKIPVDEDELLRRALGHVEFVRAHIDTEDKPDGELCVMQADILERLRRPAAAAPLLEKALDLSDQGKFPCDPKRYEELEKRLKKIDAKNAALRTARSRMHELARAAAGIVADYRSAPGHYLLRSYTLATVLGNALQDDKGLLPAAEELRKEARDAKLLLGAIHVLDAKTERWEKVCEAPPTRFAPAPGRIALECVRAQGYVDLDVPLTGEYEVRATISRDVAVDLGSALGLVVAAKPKGDALIVGIDDHGSVGIWRVDSYGTLHRDGTLFPKPAVAEDEKPVLAVHVFTDGHMTIKLGERDLMSAKIALDPATVRHVGVFAKNTTASFAEALVEIPP
jgi:hypothetical protein